MNNPRVLLTLFIKSKQKTVESFRSFHIVQALNQRTPSVSYGNTKFDNSLFFTNLPKKIKEKKKPKSLKGPLPSGNLIIKCKRPEFNYYSGMVYGKFDDIPLASKGWYHRKSKGDYFTILPPLWDPAFITREDLPKTFEESGLSKEVIQQVEKLGVTHPTVIQAKVFQPFLEGKNLFISAECGSGKTLGYLIALIENILKWKNKISNTYNAPIGIILLPTRELAVQAGILANKLAADLGIKCQTLIGGHIKELLQNPESCSVDILSCTLQVFLKHLEAGIYTASFCKHLIVDEADSFIEKSFLGQTEQFFKKSQLDFCGFPSDDVTDRKAQVCFVTATVSKEMESILYNLIKDNDMTTVTTPYLHRTISRAQQVFMRVTRRNLPEELLKIVKSNVKTKTPTMIFSNKRNTAAWVSKFLKENGIECADITTYQYASDRLTHYRNFEEGNVSIISCTDLASRGLSFSRVKQVINFEFPSFMIDYIHRCGRVGRLDQDDNCKVISFICRKHEVYLLKKIEWAVKTNSPLPSIFQDRISNYMNKNKF